ncbi:MAG: DUF2357 domain-containing protein [Bacilli bacterium]
MDNDLNVLTLYNEKNMPRIKAFNSAVKSEYEVQTNYEQVDVNFEWLEIMEDTVRYLDNILRNPNRFIVNEEEVVKVEQARRITVESIKHLSKHTNFIQEIDPVTDDVKPSKILNINKDESYNTYENRVIYTLIQNMRIFIDMRKRKLVTQSYSKNHKKGEYHGVARVGSENVNIDISMNSKADSKKTYGAKGDLSIEERIAKLELRITDLTNTSVYKSLAKAHVAKVIPPIKKTNLILKNVNFQYAMRLWDYLARYRDDGNKSTKNNLVYKEDKHVQKMFDDVFLLNYLVLNSLGGNDDKTFKKEQNREAIETLTNNMITKIVEINSDLPVEEIEKIIGDKIAVIKSKKEASVAEVSNKLNSKMQSLISKIITFDFR